MDKHFLSCLYILFQNVTNMALKRLLPRFDKEPPNLQYCTLTNISMCHITENNDKVSSCIPCNICTLPTYTLHEILPNKEVIRVRLHAKFKIYFPKI